MTKANETNVFFNLINNEWKKASTSETIESLNPSNKEVHGSVQKSSEEDLNSAIEAASIAKKGWHKIGKVARANYLNKVADIIESRIEDIGKSMAQEMGKTLAESKGETARGVAILRYYAGEGMRTDGDVIPSTDTEALMFTKRVPVGVVGIITPWNFPVAIPIWKIAPALIYGNTVVFKPATEAAVTAAKVVECFKEAELPAGVLNFITGSGSALGDPLVTHPEINAISFTGSEDVGNNVGVLASKNGKKYQLEMGGKNPVIIREDADVEEAVAGVLSGAFKSTGQKCTATSRVIVEENIYEEFSKLLVEETKKITVGNATEDVWMGPSAHESQFNTVKKYFEVAKEDGAKLEVGGEVLTDDELSKGYFVAPTVYSNVESSMRIAQEEIFGPVIGLIKAKDLTEAIEIANDTKYGLSASIYTKDISSFLQFTDEIEAGLVRINAESAGVELQAPFGGMKQSSTGSREQGQAAKEFYTEIKTVFLKG